MTPSVARARVQAWWQARCQPAAWPPREAAFALMAAQGFPVVQHGRAGLMDARPEQPVVVYTDAVSTQGDGKALTTYAQACATFPGALVSLYHPDEPGVSYRLLKIGVKTFALRYESYSDWRSNCGPEGDIALTLLPDGLIPAVPEPIWAVDFVRAGAALVAVDYNLAPGIQATGVSRHLAEWTIVGELLRYAALTGHEF